MKAIIKRVYLRKVPDFISLGPNEEIEVDKYDSYRKFELGNIEQLAEILKDVTKFEADKSRLRGGLILEPFKEGDNCLNIIIYDDYIE